MIRKHVSVNKARAKIFTKIFIVGEVIVILGTYRLFYLMNKGPDTRRYFYDRPLLRPLLSIYYKTADWRGVDNIRAYDKVAWALSDSKSDS